MQNWQKLLIVTCVTLATGTGIYYYVKKRQYDKINQKIVNEQQALQIINNL